MIENSYLISNKGDEYNIDVNPHKINIKKNRNIISFFSMILFLLIYLKFNYRKLFK